MKTLPFFILVLASLTALGQASTEPVPIASPTPSPGQPTKFDAALLGGTKPDLTEQEKVGVAVTDAWKERSLQTMVGQPGSTSSVVFRFGESYPSIVCAVLEVTDVELQPGEAVTQINLGDTVRWSVESSKSGSGTDQVEHIVIKPRDVGLQTSLVVTTDRRTYHLLLRSNEGGFMYYVRFQYSESSVAAASPTPNQSPAPGDDPVVETKPHPRRVNQGDGKAAVSFVAREQVDDADESYVVSGKADWKPVEVYSKDGKTYIEMPESVRHKEAPVLFQEKRSGWFHHDKVLVNYRVHGRWYVVDRVLDKATLVSGVGSGQEKVSIEHVELVRKVEGTTNGK